MSDPTNAHSLIVYDEESLSVRLYRLIQSLIEDFLEIIYAVVTQKSKLERVLEGRWESRASQMVLIEKCLRARVNGAAHPSMGGLRYRRVAPNVQNTDDDTELVLKEEQVKADGDRRLAMKIALERARTFISAYDELCVEVETLRTESYDKTNPKHEKMLRKLFRLMCPDEELTGMVSRQWREIGFQGDDPSTDFRGMGILSLHQLIFFAQFDVAAMHSVLGLSRHPTIGFPFAIAGITFTSLTRALLSTEQLKRHFYNTLAAPPTIEDVHRVYCRVFSLFAEYWRRAHPPTIMHFNAVRMAFERSLSIRLSADDANLDEMTVEDLP